MFADLPPQFTYEDVQRMAQDREAWKQLVMLRGYEADMAKFMTVKLTSLPPLPATMNESPTNACDTGTTTPATSTTPTPDDETYRHYTSAPGAAAASAVQQALQQEERCNPRPRLNRPTAAAKRRKRGLKRKRATARRAARTLPKRVTGQPAPSDQESGDSETPQPPAPVPAPTNAAKPKKKRKRR